MAREDSHSISLLVNNKPGVLIRISLVFARRGYNIDSLVVSPAHNRQFSRMSITASGDPETLVLILGQLNKLVDVIHATDHTGDVVVQRELALIKVDCTAERRTEVLQISEHFKCQSIDISDTTLLLEATGNSDKLDALELILEKYGIVEIVRSGKLVMARGASAT
jgi:acetolactate synthase-1/3 small subunit